jgi:hypothetical protein
MPPAPVLPGPVAQCQCSGREAERIGGYAPGLARGLLLGLFILIASLEAVEQGVQLGAVEGLKQGLVGHAIVPRGRPRWSPLRVRVAEPGHVLLEDGRDRRYGHGAPVGAVHLLRAGVPGVD